MPISSKFFFLINKKINKYQIHSKYMILKKSTILLFDKHIVFSVQRVVSKLSKLSSPEICAAYNN